MSSTTLPTSDYTKNINESGVFYPILILLIFLITFILLFVFKKDYVTSFLTFSIVNGEKSVEAEVRDSVLVLVSIFCIVLALFAVIPNFETIKKLFFDSDMRTVSAMIVYTISLVVLLTTLPSETMNKYSYIITPLTISIGAILFLISHAVGFFKTSGFTEYVRSIILFVCLVATSSIFYTMDPGGLIQKYFNSTLLNKILVSTTGLFALLYTIINLSVFSSNKNASAESTNTSRFIGPGLFIIFAFLASFVYGVGYTDFAKDKTSVTSVTVLSLIVMFLWSILLGAGISSINVSPPDIKEYKKSALKLFGVVLASIIAMWFIQNIGNTPAVLNVVEWGAGIILSAALLLIVYKILSKVYEKTVPYDLKKKAEETVKDNANSFFGLLSNELNNENSLSSLIALISVILVFGGYFVGPIIYNKYSISGGKVLLSGPSNLNEQNTLATYEELNGPVPETEPTKYDGGASRTFNYNYGLSFWVYIDSSAPNTNPSYSKYTSILNYGGKPNVLYKASTNTLVITFDDSTIEQDQDIDDINETNDYGRRIVYKNENFALQRWNHFVINYSGRYLDVFLNGELVKSNIKVVPHMNLDSLVSGSENGIYGGLCNIVYYNKPLTITKIYYIYSTLKDKTPPVL
jgi:hypothetical protein